MSFGASLVIFTFGIIFILLSLYSRVLNKIDGLRVHERSHCKHEWVFYCLDDVLPCEDVGKFSSCYRCALACPKCKNAYYPKRRENVTAKLTKEQWEAVLVAGVHQS